MPTEPLAALVYVFLLLPGIAYAFESEKHRPAGKRSAFAETATIVVASSIFCITILSIALIVSAFSKPVKLWLDSFIASPNELLAESPRGMLTTIIVTLVAAAMLGAYAGRRGPQKLLRRVATKPDDIDATASGWWKSFELMPDAVKVVSVQLKSGRWLSGQLRSYNASSDESTDRSFVLVGKIQFRAPGSEDTQILDGVQSVVIHASEIDYIGVNYVTREAAKKLNE